jgi:hypothetical protein
MVIVQDAGTLLGASPVRTFPPNVIDPEGEPLFVRRSIPLRFGSQAHRSNRTIFSKAFTPAQGPEPWAALPIVLISSQR